MTNVVNIKAGKPYDKYIGRTGKGKDGYFGNPHEVGFCKLCNREHTRDECLQEFIKYFHSRLRTDPEFKRRVDGLKDRTLGCFCKPLSCHGDVYVEYLEPVKEPVSKSVTFDDFGLTT